jgi:ATP-dependent helicase/nuclease subunit A
LYETGTPDWGNVVAGEPARHESLQAASVANVQRLIRETQSAAVGTRGTAMVSPSSLESSGRVEVARLLAAVPQVATQRGSVMHAWFEQIDWLPNAGDAAFDRQAMFDIARRIVPEVSDAELAGMWTAFERMLSREAVREALSIAPAAKLPELWRERSFVVAIDDQLMRGTFDRVVITRDAKGDATAAHIIDFKTDAVADEAVLAERVAFYKPQIRAYRRALAALTGLSARGNAIRSTLLFVGKGVAVDV